jgi:hypothetical protein
MWSHPAMAQEIEELPVGFDGTAIFQTDLETAFQNLHAFSEYLVNAGKITQINPPGSSPEFLEDPNLHWGDGSWGRGYFTRYIDLYQYNGETDRYGDWWATQPGDYWMGSHPLIRHIARRVCAYIHKYRAGGDSGQSLYLTRIQEALTYMLGQQYLNDGSAYYGSFIMWGGRPDQQTPNLDDDHTGIPLTYPDEYETSCALMALAEGYMFLQEIDLQDDAFMKQLYTAIVRAADWLMVHSVKYDEYPDNPLSNYTGAIEQVNNFKAFAVSGLAYAYAATGKARYLNRGLDIFERCIDQRQLLPDDGAWTYPPRAEFHDTYPYYIGIILRALVDLSEALPPAYGPHAKTIDAADNLRARVIDAINHFLLPGLAYPTGHGSAYLPRLLPDGEVLQYVEQFNLGTSYQSEAFQLAEALTKLTRSGVFSTFSYCDREKITSLRNGILRPMVNANLQKVSIHSDIVMKNVALFKDEAALDMPKFRDGILGYSRLGDGSGINMIDLFKPGSPPPPPDHRGHSTSGHPFSLLATGDFDGDRKDEFALYRDYDGLVVIYNPGHETYNGSAPAIAGYIGTGVTNFDAMSALDWDNDGFDEIVFYSKQGGGTPSTDNRISIYKTGSQLHTGYSDSAATFDSMTTGDFDMDGRDEIALYRKSDSKIVVYNPGYASYQSSGPSFALSFKTNVSNFDHMDTIDYDLDGFDDLILYSKQGGGAPATDNMVTIYYREASQLKSHTGYSNSSVPFDAMTTGDFDNDGKEEFALYRAYDGLICIYNPGHSEYNGLPPAGAGSIQTYITNFNLLAPIKGYFTTQ